MDGRRSILAETKPSHTRTIFQAPIAFLLIYLIGCSQINPAPRDQLVENLAPIRKIEEGASKLTVVYQKLMLIGLVNDEDNKKLREHYDVYYIYHKAAAVSLARGDVESYNSYVGLAAEELARIESKMRFLVQIKPD
jgi:uncharacterized protein YcfL